MQAITFQFNYVRLAFAKMLGMLSPSGYLSSLGPLALEDVPDAKVMGDDWVLVRPRYSGICGSDVKQIFLDGAFDNPMTAVISFPHVLGHETAGEIVEKGKGVTSYEVGDKVVCYPWLTCEVRGLPLCEACESGHLTSCRNVTSGRFAPGIHAGNCRDVSGAFAPLIPAHTSMCIRVPQGAPLDHAVLTDPVAVSLHAILKAPPSPGERVLVIGCGALGMAAIHLCHKLYDGVEVWAYDKHDYLEPTITELGATRYVTSGGEAFIDEVAATTKSRTFKPWKGLPWLQDGFDKIYDTVGSAKSLELAIRIAKAQGTIVVPGVAEPKRFEWTPLYFKELHLIGSNGAGIEDFEGRRVHAFQAYLELVDQGRLDLASIVTHRYPLAEYREAFLAARNKAECRSIKVVFDFDDAKSS